MLVSTGIGGFDQLVEVPTVSVIAVEVDTAGITGGQCVPCTNSHTLAVDINGDTKLGVAVASCRLKNLFKNPVQATSAVDVGGTLVSVTVAVGPRRTNHEKVIRDRNAVAELCSIRERWCLQHSCRNPATTDIAVKMDSADGVPSGRMIRCSYGEPVGRHVQALAIIRSRTIQDLLEAALAGIEDQILVTVQARVRADLALIRNAITVAIVAVVISDIATVQDSIPVAVDNRVALGTHKSGDRNKVNHKHQEGEGRRLHGLTSNKPAQCRSQRVYSGPGNSQSGKQQGLTCLGRPKLQESRGCKVTEVTGGCCRCHSQGWVACPVGWDSRPNCFWKSGSNLSLSGNLPRVVIH